MVIKLIGGYSLLCPEKEVGIRESTIPVPNVIRLSGQYTIMSRERGGYTPYTGHLSYTFTWSVVFYIWLNFTSVCSSATEGGEGQREGEGGYGVWWKGELSTPPVISEKPRSQNHFFSPALGLNRDVCLIKWRFGNSKKLFFLFVGVCVCVPSPPLHVSWAPLSVSGETWEPHSVSMEREWDSERES